jgi:signal transduction histidine kinase/ligand-binding sensor domain-containing protein
MLVTYPGPLRAQASSLLYERLHAAQGLFGNEVHCILQDTRGYMWFGTEKGLNRYDGYTFTVYKHDPDNPWSIVDDRVQSLWEDKQGTLWVGTWNGLERFDRGTGTFQHFRPKAEAPPGDWSNVIYDLFEDSRGILWVSGSGLKSFDRSTETFTSHPHTVPPPHPQIQENVDAVYEDRSGNLWLGTAGALEKFDRATGTYTQYWVDESIHKNGEPNYNGFHWIQKIYEDRSGILWLCTNGGPVAFNRKSGTFKPYRIYPAEPDSSPSQSVSSITEDEKGVLWIGSWGGGYLTYNSQADSFEPHSVARFFPLKSVASLCRDRGGIIWIGTNGDGVIKATREEKRFTGFAHDPGDFPEDSRRIPPLSASIQNNDVRFVDQADSGFVILGTGTGVDRFDPERVLFKHWATWDWPYSITGALRSRFGPVLYTGVVDGFNRVYNSPYRRIGISTRDSGLGDSPCSFFEDRRGILWMLTSEAGVVQFDPRTNSFKRLGIGSPQQFVAARMFIEDSLDDTLTGWGLWIGSGDGLWHYNARLEAFTRYGHDAKDPSSLSSNIVTTVFRDRKGTLWVGTDKGLNRMDRTPGTFARFQVERGLPDNAVQGILEDRRGCLWVSTKSAISKMDFSATRFASYSMKDILPGIQFGAGCCLHSDRHEMYFGGNGGFVRFNPDSVRENMYIPPVVITGFKTFDAPVDLDSAIGEMKSIELSFRENVFSFHFAALNFVHPENNQYAYTLVGHDTSWNHVGTRQYARYANVEPGSYTFRVKASNNDGIWNEVGTSLAVIITPPWWKTTWFSIGLWATALLSLGGTIRYIERRKLKKRIAELEKERAVERERARISQDMHDEVGSSLSEIAILSELAKKRPADAGEHVEEISERTAELIDNVSEIVWAMNPKNDTFDNLVGHLRRYAVKYLNISGLACEFVAPEFIPAIPLPAEVRRNVFLVVKEALHNAVKYSEASVVQLSLAIHDRLAELTLKDNGRGFGSGEIQGSGNGLPNMRKRMEDVHGSFEIRSGPGQGTTVMISFPIA